jgi:DNA polymerase-3 subunit beta
MKVTILRSALIKPLQLIAGVVEKRQTLPVLSNVLLKFIDNTFTVTGTDLEIELIGTVAITEGIQEGAITVSAKKLSDICRALPEEALLKLSLEGEQLIIRSGSSRFVLTTLPAVDFPNVEVETFPHQFEIDQAKLRNLIGKTHFAMGQQDVRHYLNGSLFDINQGVVKCVATDGHRLAFSTIEEANAANLAVKIILPRKSVLELVRLLDPNSDEKSLVCISTNHFRIISADFTFTSKLIHAQYPDYEKLIPKTISDTAIAGSDALKQALVRASILSNEKFRGIRLHLQADHLRIVANNPEQEEAEEMVSIQYDGKGLEIGFNAAYLLDAVSAVGSEQVKWSFNGSNSGVLIEPADKTDCMYVIMPMRL